MSTATRQVVRKRLDDDCLLDRQLHPSIAERLNRIRELPVSNVANFHGVELDADGVWLVWQYIDGVTLEEFLLAKPQAAEIERLKKELQITLAAIHSHGIVHGAVHGRNIIIDLHGGLRLTHISPLLFSDPAEDDRAAKRLFDSRDSAANITATESRLPAYLAAAGTLLAAVVIAVAILWYIHA